MADQDRAGPDRDVDGGEPPPGAVDHRPRRVQHLQLGADGLDGNRRLPGTGRAQEQHPLPRNQSGPHLLDLLRHPTARLRRRRPGRAGPSGTGCGTGVIDRFQVHDRAHRPVRHRDHVEAGPHQLPTRDLQLAHETPAAGDGLGADLPERRPVEAVEQAGRRRVGQHERLVDRHDRTRGAVGGSEEGLEQRPFGDRRALLQAGLHAGDRLGEQRRHPRAGVVVEAGEVEDALEPPGHGVLDGHADARERSEGLGVVLLAPDDHRPPFLGRGAHPVGADGLLGVGGAGDETDVVEQAVEVVAPGPPVEDARPLVGEHHRGPGVGERRRQAIEHRPGQ